MADVFNKNPDEYVDLNELFPKLDDSVGFHYEQLRKIVENINYLKNKQGSSVSGVSSINGKTGAVVLTAEDVNAAAKVSRVPISQGGESQSVLENSVNQLTFTTQDVDVEGNIINKKSADLFPEGMNFHDLQRPYINGTERMAYLSDIESAIGNVSTLLGATDDLGVE